LKEKTIESGKKVINLARKTRKKDSIDKKLEQLKWEVINLERENTFYDSEHPGIIRTKKEKIKQIEYSIKTAGKELAKLTSNKSLTQKMEEVNEALEKETDYNKKKEMQKYAKELEYNYKEEQKKQKKKEERKKSWYGAKPTITLTDKVMRNPGKAGKRTYEKAAGIVPDKFKVNSDGIKYGHHRVKKIPIAGALYAGASIGTGRGAKKAGRGAKKAGKVAKAHVGRFTSFFGKTVGGKAKSGFKSGVDDATNLSAYTVLFFTIGLLFYTYYVKSVAPILVSIGMSITIFFIFIMVLKRKNYRLLTVIFALDVILTHEVLAFFSQVIPLIETNLATYLVLIAPWALYVALIENPFDGFIEKMTAVATFVALIFFVGNAIGLDVINAYVGDADTSEIEASLERNLESLPGGSAVSSSISWFTGLFDPEQYSLNGQTATVTTELKGIVFLDSEVSRTDFKQGDKILVIKEIELLGDLQEGENINLQLSCEIGDNPGTIKPNNAILTPSRSTQVVTCQGDADEKGNHEVRFKAEYNESTVLEIQPPIIKESIYLNYINAGQNPFEVLGYEQREIRSAIENNPLEVRFDLAGTQPPPIPIATEDEQDQQIQSYGNPLYGLQLFKNNQLKGNERTIWQGNIKNIKALIDLPKGLSFEDSNERECDLRKVNNETDATSIIKDYCVNLERIATQTEPTFSTDDAYTRFIDLCLDTQNIHHQIIDSRRVLDNKNPKIELACFLKLEDETEFFGEEQIVSKIIRNKIDYTVEVIETETIRVEEVVIE